MWSSKLLLLVALATAPFAGGCVPTVELRAATVRGPSPGGLQFDAVLAIDNPNTFDVSVENIDGTIRIEGVRGLVPMHAQPHVWCRAGRRTIVQVPVIVPYAMIPQIIATSVSNPTVKFNMVGRARVLATSTYRWQQVHDIDQDGELPRNMFLQFGGGSPWTVGVKR